MRAVKSLLAALLLLVAAPAQAAPLFGTPWYKDAVIYTLDVDSFKDSDGDGTGDFKGLTEKLDYIKALGADTIWLSPFQPTPNKDDGYDISDFYGIDPRLGTKADFDAFMQAAKERKIRVLMDLVLNHTSDQHPWFVQAREHTPTPYRNWYVWSKSQPKDWNKGMVFPGVQTEVWSYDDQARAYYFHRFYDFQPDLNYENKQVVAEAFRVIDYWISQGITGFRLDAVPFVIEDPRSDMEKPDHDFAFLYNMRSAIEARNRDGIILGEANVLPDENKDYFGPKGRGLQMMFNFYANQYLFYALASGDPKLFVQALENTRAVAGQSQWAFFLRNHDEVDLGRLSPRQRQLVYDKFGPAPDMQLYDRGIRRRLAPMLGNDREMLELAYSMSFAFPGTPVIRYGDEIGMGDDLSLQERLSVRTPMQWDASAQGGFTSGQPFRPVIAEGDFGYPRVNVASEAQNSGSLYNWMAKLVQVRREVPVIGRGAFEVMRTQTPQVVALHYADKGDIAVTLHNFSAASQTVSFDASGTKALHDLFDGTRLTPEGSRYTVTLGRYGYRWYRAE